MAFLPVNFFFVALFVFGIVWGWEGEEMRQLFALISSIFMFPLWFSPLYIITENSGTIAFVSRANWLPTFILGNILFWNMVLMYWTGIHLMETLGRQDPVGKGLKRLRKTR